MKPCITAIVKLTMNYMYHLIADANWCVDLAQIKVWGYTLHLWFNVKVGQLPILFSDKSWFDVYTNLISINWSITRECYAQSSYLGSMQGPNPLVSASGLNWPASVLHGQAPNPFADWQNATLRGAVEGSGPIGTHLSASSSSAATVTPVGIAEASTSTPGQTTLARVGLPASILAMRHVVSSFPDICISWVQSNGVLILVLYLIIRDLVSSKIFRVRRH